MKINTKNENLLIERLELGPISTNCYIVTNQKEQISAIIDPAGGIEVIKNHLLVLGTKVVFILNTHGHFDHIGANAYLQELSKGKLYIHKDDEYMLKLGSKNDFGIKIPVSSADGLLEDGQILPFGEMQFQVLHTPGHTPGGVCFLLNNQVLFAGDTLFKHSIGRSDFPGGSFEQLIDGIKSKLFVLPDEVVVFPGHGDDTTIGIEKNSNPYVRA